MTTPDLSDPRALLRHLYDVAVQRALPLHNTAAHLPPWCWARARPVGRWRG
jgi:hydroxypyruvate reductase